MVETDWRELLSFSQRELKQADKEKLCENLSWMEADDIDLNFTDLKTLFRLAQDILKFKSEQVNNLLGQLETQRKTAKGKAKGTYVASPTRSNDSVLDTIADQEEVIKANKEILEQLYADIAELEGKKLILEEKKEQGNDTDSSRDALSELNAVAQLENEVTLKNRHIRKLLGDVKMLEEDNNELKEKVSILKDKLTEATRIIENLTDQIFTLNNESTKLKENLGQTIQTKAHLSVEIESLRKELHESQNKKESFLEDVKAKVQHWKNEAKSKRIEIEALEDENTKLKEVLIQTPKASSPKPKLRVQEEKMKELQSKLSQASQELLQSAKLIERLKMENQRLKLSTEDITEYSATEIKNESDEGKEMMIINKLKKKVKLLTGALAEAEERITTREEELVEVSSQLKLIKDNEGVKEMIDTLKQKKYQLKVKNGEIRSLIKEINTLNEFVDNLQLENECMRQKLNIPLSYAIDKKETVNKYQKIQKENQRLTRELKETENKLVTVELENRNLILKTKNLVKVLTEMGYQSEKIDEICDDDIPQDSGIDSSRLSVSRPETNRENISENTDLDAEMRAIAEENEGLRKGLQEILNFLKDNSKASSGVLALQCPSLEAVLQSMEARHAAGWFAPHMAAVMELKAALGGRDALLTALNDARKETFDIMDKLTKESKKTIELEEKLTEMKSKMAMPQKGNVNEIAESDFKIGEIGSWLTDKDYDKINLNDRNEIESYVSNCDLLYENKLRSGLAYFHSKFDALFNKMTSLAIEAADDRNNWRIEEEQYKAQIENLKAQIIENMDDSISDNSPGLVSIPNVAVLQRRCSYLEESYKYLRTLNENIQNEHLDCQRDAMLAASQYETQINRMVLTIIDVTNKLRKSISMDLFWKQNNMLVEILSKYRLLLTRASKNNSVPFDLIKRLEKDKLDIISELQKHLNGVQVHQEVVKDLDSVEASILQKQLQEVCNELNEKEKEIEQLQIQHMELQNRQANLIDQNLSAITNEEVASLNSRFQESIQENKTLKEQVLHVSKQLDIALLQLQDRQHKQLDTDMEINMLRHQILDLQSVGDNKAIIARLSGEVLVAHLQASESHKKMDRLNILLNKERQSRIEAEEMLKARHNIFDVYAARYENKFRYLYEVMQALRQQYHGSVPLTSIENYQNNLEELIRKTQAVNAKLNEIENLQASLIIKHSIFEQILDLSKNKCLDDDDACEHKLKLIVTESQLSRESDYLKKKIQTLEQSRNEIMSHCNNLEKSLLLVNQGFEKSTIEDIIGLKKSKGNITVTNMEVEDLVSDEDSISRRSQTITLPKPKVLKPPNDIKNKTKHHTEIHDALPGSPMKTPDKAISLKTVDVLVQTSVVEREKNDKLVQTLEDPEVERLKNEIYKLRLENEEKRGEIIKAISIQKQQTIDMLNTNTAQISQDIKIKELQNVNEQKDKLINSLNISIDDLRRQLESKHLKILERDEIDDSVQKENKKLLHSLKNIETEKNKIVEEYQKAIDIERDEYIKSTKDLQTKIQELQAQLERRDSDSEASFSEKLQIAVAKYSHKIVQLEDECFNLRNKVEGSKTELMSYQSEIDRWKNLASQRLTKMEQLSSQLEERHSHEVESYKAENQHWLSQLSETQREHLELRSKLSEQKALHVKQAADKDVQIEQLRSTIHNLKSQIMNMQTIMAVNDPSFDLSAIVEVEEVSDVISQHGSERLELKFDTALDLQDIQDDLRMPATSTAIWQEPIIERLRREKQLVSKQNAMLRRQIKALASRERRARLDAHNLKNQVFRISTSGSKVATAETAALHHKIASLQAQLSSARRDTNSNVALWDKWKRAQQSSDRWQTRFEDKCQEVKKLEISLNLAKSALSRLEKEKRVLLARLNEVKSESRILIEKQEGEHSEKSLRQQESSRFESPSPPPVSSQALLDRVQAQQRRIAALEFAEKGNEVLVSEYEKSLAEITALKGQVLKLESSLLESQIRLPLKPSQETQPELEYWKSYCEMLKEENVQLTLRVNTFETTPTNSHQHRINDLEQTILTLRGLVSKFQAEQKSSVVHRRVESGSRPGSGHSGTEKGRNQIESLRVEIANLKRTIQDKDLLLEKSKEMLKIAAEREEDLLKENMFLRRRLNDFNKTSGFLSA